MKKLLFIPILFLLGCNPCKYVAKHQECFNPDSIIIEKTKTIRDSIVYTKIDSIGYDILFECDSNFQVVMKEFNELKAKGSTTKFIFKDNRLKLAVLMDSIAHLNRIIDNTTNKEIVKINPLNESLKTENITLIQKAKTKNKIIFILILIILSLLVVYKFLR